MSNEIAWGLLIVVTSGLIAAMIGAFLDWRDKRRIIRKKILYSWICTFENCGVHLESPKQEVLDYVAMDHMKRRHGL